MEQLGSGTHSKEAKVAVFEPIVSESQNLPTQSLCYVVCLLSKVHVRTHAHTHTHPRIVCHSSGGDAGCYTDTHRGTCLPQDGGLDWALRK